MRILIAPDKFKGTLSASEAARAIASGWRRARPGDDLTLLPMSDGGDGFGDVLRELLGARTLSLATTDAAGALHRARWWWVDDRKLALIESAQSNGLALLPKGTHHPFELDTFGVARLVQFALAKGARHCIVGVGGSATNDGGFGLARGLGWSFLDASGKPIRSWTNLERLARVEPPRIALPKCRFTVATDVDNPLLGPLGASRIYGPQKGLQPKDMAKAEACLGRLAEVMQRQFHVDSTLPGSGAAGGLGYGFMAFLGARRRLGFEIFAECAQLARKLADSDLVITGEGAFDLQSVMGKGVGQWIQRCKSRHLPVIVLAGSVAPETARASKVIQWAKGLCDLTSRTEALRRPAVWLRRLAYEAASQYALPSLNPAPKSPSPRRPRTRPSS